MKKSRREVRTKLKAVKKNKEASRMLRFLQSTGLFRWERPSTHTEEFFNILTHGIGIGLAIAGLAMLVSYAVLGNRVVCNIWRNNVHIIFWFNNVPRDNWRPVRGVL